MSYLENDELNIGVPIRRFAPRENCNNDYSASAINEQEKKSNAKELKARVSFSKLLEYHGKTMTATTHGKKCRCPFHEDYQDKFYIHSNDSSARCYCCEWRGDIYDYLMKKDDTGFCEAIEKLEQLEPRIKREEGGISL